jgi:PAS domain S-box-containing protein
MSLPRSAKALSALLDQAQDKIALVDEAGTFQYVNAASERILGYDPDALVDTDAFAYVHPEDVDGTRETFETVIRAESATTEEHTFRFRANDGSWKHLESRMSNMQDSTLDGYVISSRDVTERERAREAHREVSERLVELTDNTNDVLWMFDGAFDELLFVNGAYEDIWGRSVDVLESNPQDFVEGIHPEDRQRVQQAMERMTRGQPIDLEYRVNPTENYRRWVWVQGSAIYKAGEVARVVGFARDVTDRRRRDQHLHTIDRMLRHNLRNDLNVILGHAHAAGEAGDSTVAEHVQRILDNGERLLETAEKERQIVEFLQAGTTRGRIDLVSAIESAIADVAEEWPDATIESALPESASVVAVPDFDIVVRELLENAIEHAENDAPTVSIGVTHEGNTVVLRVEDDGPPISEQEVVVLEGAGDADPLAHGSGLGLWLIHWAVTLSDGDLSFERRPEGGNALTIRLPAALGEPPR